MCPLFPGSSTQDHEPAWTVTTRTEPQGIIPLSADAEKDSEEIYGKSRIAGMAKHFGPSLLVATGTIYFSQGFRSFSGLALSFYLKDYMGLQPAEMQSYVSLTILPWSIKPLYGLLSDNIPLFRRHRQPYLLTCSLLAAIAPVLLASLSPKDPPFVVALLCLGNLGLAFNDVVADAVIVARSRKGPGYLVSSVMSWTWFWLFFGGMLGASLSGVATTQLGPHLVFFLSALAPAAVFAVSMFMVEPATGKVSFGILASQIKKLVKATLHRQVLPAILWIFLSQAIVPSTSSVMFFFYTNQLHFSAEFLSLASVIGYCTMMVSSVLYNWKLASFPIRWLLFWTQILSSFAIAIDLLLITGYNRTVGVPDKTFVLGSEIFGDCIGQIHLMPLLVLAAKVCPPGVEATLFAMIMSVNNLTNMVSLQWGAYLSKQMGVTKDDMTQLWKLHTIRACLVLVGAMFVWMIPNVRQDDKLGLGDPMEDGGTVNASNEADEGIELEECGGDQSPVMPPACPDSVSRIVG